MVYQAVTCNDQTQERLAVSEDKAYIRIIQQLAFSIDQPAIEVNRISYINVCFKNNPLDGVINGIPVC